MFVGLPEYLHEKALQDSEESTQMPFQVTGHK